jgi:hypothetical protein
VREQFSRLEVGQPQQNFMRDMGGNEPKSATMGAAASTSERDWMNFASNTQTQAPRERPTTANSNARVTHLENQLKDEKRQNKLLGDQIETMRKELVKANFASFTQGA